LAFYDTLETNDRAVKVLGDETLRGIARELVTTVRKNVTFDWTLRENVRAQRRVLVKRILKRHGYPPDEQEKATQTVLEQAALLSAEWESSHEQDAEKVIPPLTRPTRPFSASPEPALFGNRRRTRLLDLGRDDSRRDESPFSAAC
jgi:hypothetical protein